jgi:hypothetical protein
MPAVIEAGCLQVGINGIDQRLHPGPERHAELLRAVFTGERQCDQAFGNESYLLYPVAVGNAGENEPVTNSFDF